MLLDKTQIRGRKTVIWRKGKLAPKHHSLRQGQRFFIIDHREGSPTPVLLRRMYVRREPRRALLASDADALCELVDLVGRRNEEKGGC